MVAATTPRPASDPRTAGSSPIHPSTPVPTSPRSPLPTPDSPLPLLSPADEAILTRLFEINAPSLTDLFKSLTRGRIDGAPQTLLDLFRWSHRPEIKPWLDIHASEQSAAIRRRRIAKLEQIADTSKDLVEQRRACTTALRALDWPFRVGRVVGGMGGVGRASGPPSLANRAGASPPGPSEPRPSGSGNLQPPAAPIPAQSARQTAPSPVHPLTCSPVHPSHDNSEPPPASSPTHPSTHSPLHASPDSLLELTISHIQTPRDPASIAALAGALAPTATINSSLFDPRTPESALATLPNPSSFLTDIDPPTIEESDTTFSWSSTLTYAQGDRTHLHLELTLIKNRWQIASLNHRIVDSG